jgi:hypothetical protein
MMTRFHVVAIAVGLMLLISAPSFAAQQSRQPSSAHSKGAVKKEPAVKKDRGVVTSPYDSSVVPPYDPRGTSAYPFGPGINFPYPDRPYGDPGRW